MRFTKLFVAICLSFAAAAATAACIKVEYGDQPFLCDPHGGAPNCPEEYKCCSDDPAAMTAKGDELVSDPDALPGINKNESAGVKGEDGFGKPLFAGDDNNKGNRGVCVRPGSMEPAFTGTDAVGCPVPCNPQWATGDVELVCGKKGSVCCQTVELDTKDCVADDKGCFHPATGADALSGAVEWPKELTTPQLHTRCKDWKSRTDAYNECISVLGVASSRGFCIAPDSSGKSKACPLAGKSNVCEAKNAGNAECE